MKRIAVVVPTIREDCWAQFLEAWYLLFKEYGVILVKVVDGELPVANVLDHLEDRPCSIDGMSFSPADVLEQDASLIHNFSPACRNLGFALVAKELPEVETIITLDDDCAPVCFHDDGDVSIVNDTVDNTISQHLEALTKRVPTSWLNTMSDGVFPRGFPYRVRQEWPVMVSHGVWMTIPDWDAPTQLQIEAGHMQGDDYSFYQGPIPQGIYFPFCGMNVAFRREVLPYMYYAPVNNLEGCQRFDDMWAGTHLKDYCDEQQWAIVSGYALCEHTRASHVFKNLKQEAVGLEVTETYYLDHGQAIPEFKEAYRGKRELWLKRVGEWLQQQN
jgi:reversibly glycosylated polypeptide/UDP-arabinopyranose mutase